MRPLVALSYSHRNGYLPILEEQLGAGGFEFISEVIKDFSWSRQCLWNLDVAKRFPDRYLVFLGAWDTVCLGEESQVVDLGWQDHISVAGDMKCWPDEKRIPEYKKKQGPVTNGPWRYVNTGPLAGLGWRIMEAMEWGWKRFPVSDDKLFEGGENDQRFWTDLYLESEFDIRVDYECRLGQTMSDSQDYLYIHRKTDTERALMLNSFHRTHPIFAHANAKVPLHPFFLEQCGHDFGLGPSVPSEAK